MEFLFRAFLCVIFFTNCVTTTRVPRVKLLSGHYMPVLGYGTFTINGQLADIGVDAALKSGYQLIDAGYIYGNEKDIGRAVGTWIDNGGKREDLFISTKLSPQSMRSSEVTGALEKSLKNLGVDYVDMYLAHLPLGIFASPEYNLLAEDYQTNFTLDYSTDIIAVWKAMEKQVKNGKAKSIGLSNFNMTQFLRIWEIAEIKPSNLQMETNPYIQNDELLALCKELGVVLTGYSPLGSGNLERSRRKRDLNIVSELPQLLENSVVVQIADKHNKSPAQIVLRYNFQRNVISVPRSKNPDHIKENIDIFDFELTQEDMATLKTLDEHGYYKKIDFSSLKGWQSHPEYPFGYLLEKV